MFVGAVDVRELFYVISVGGASGGAEEGLRTDCPDQGSCLPE